MTACSVYIVTAIHAHPSSLTVYVQGSELISKKVSPPSDKLDSPVLAFLSLEHYNAVRLVQAVHSSLADLNKVLRGAALLTTNVHRLATALLRHEVRLTGSGVMVC